MRITTNTTAFEILQMLGASLSPVSRSPANQLKIPNGFSH
jgi:hypothetical protein